MGTFRPSRTQPANQSSQGTLQPVAHPATVCGMRTKHDSSQTRSLQVRDTLEINLLGVATIPVLAFIGPRVERNDADACRIRIPLNYRTRNHMGSLYFGVLAAGADVVSGLPVMRLMRERGQFLVPSFKDVRAEFLRRAEGDTVFENTDIDAITDAYEEALRTGQRVNLPVHVIATVPSRDPVEPVARFTTTLSMKYAPDRPTPWYQRILAKV